MNPVVTPLSAAPFVPAGEAYHLTNALVEHTAIAGGANPLANWKHHGAVRGDMSCEYLTPRLVCAPSQEEFAFLQRQPRMTGPDMAAEIAALAPWTYHVEALGASTRRFGSYNDRTIVFHRHRANLISATVARLLGESRQTATALDLGCNCGFFTLDLAARGFSKVLGVDLREENLRQARFLKGAFGLDNAEFQGENVKNLIEAGLQFDVVLNLGLMYHLSTPFEVMKMCFDATRDFCVVDTITHTEPFSGYFVALKDTSKVIEGDLSFELQPTYRGMLDTIRAAGFRDVIEVVAPVSDVELYDNGSRRCLIAFKEPAERYLSRLQLVS